MSATAVVVKGLFEKRWAQALGGRRSVGALDQESQGLLQIESLVGPPFFFFFFRGVEDELFFFSVFTWPIWMGIVAKVMFKVMFKVEVGL